MKHIHHKIEVGKSTVIFVEVDYEEGLNNFYCGLQYSNQATTIEAFVRAIPLMQYAKTGYYLKYIVSNGNFEGENPSFTAHLFRVEESYQR